MNSLTAAKKKRPAFQSSPGAGRRAGDAISGGVKNGPADLAISGASGWKCVRCGASTPTPKEKHPLNFRNHV